MKRLLLLPAITLFIVSCDGTNTADLDKDWLRVLQQKKAAAASTATPQAKQIYADSLRAFLQKHPQHGRARAVYQHIQIDFARELVAIGRYQDAIRFYRAVLSHDPTNVDATEGIAVAMDHLAVPRSKLLALQRGMSQREVAHLLGKPIPGWQVKSDRGETMNEAWYYRTTEGGVAAVYFRDGVLFAAEAKSQEKIARMSYQ